MCEYGCVAPVTCPVVVLPAHSPNKKFGAGPLARYRAVEELATATGRQYLQEVGARDRTGGGTAGGQEESCGLGGGPESGLGWGRGHALHYSSLLPRLYNAWAACVGT